jgi:Mrp family chromosome partitioning ATPase
MLARPLQEAFLMRNALRLLSLAPLAGAALAWSAGALSPNLYTASAAVILPEGAAAAGSRVVRIRHAAGDPREAAALVNAELEDFRSRQAEVLDSTMVLPASRDPAAGLALGAAAGVLAGAALLVAQRRRRRPVRSESDFVGTLGQPLLAARPLRFEGLDELCRQLLDHWITPQRRLVPVVSAEPGEGRSALAAELAKRFAAMGEKVLLVDADFRSPSLHRRFGLSNRAGLGDFLAGRGTSIVACGENLGLIVAGSCGDALDALSSPRLPAFLVEAGKHFRVVIIDTPAAARGPDLQMPAALAGGALVVARPGEERGEALARLHSALEGASARVIATLINRG